MLRNNGRCVERLRTSQVLQSVGQWPNTFLVGEKERVPVACIDAVSAPSLSKVMRGVVGLLTECYQRAGRRPSCHQRPAYRHVVDCGGRSAMPVAGFGHDISMAATIAATSSSLGLP